MKDCSVCGSQKSVSTSPKLTGFFCGRHREQLRRHGHIKKRTITDRNDFIGRVGYYEIITFDRYGNAKACVKIDTSDLPSVVGHKWCVDKNGYAMSWKTGALHRFLMGARRGLEVDHINRDKLDNRRSNLRFVSKSQNNRNIDWGNVYKQRSGRWYVSFSIDGKQKSFGTFSNKREAEKLASKIHNELCDGKTIEEYLATIEK